MWKNSIKRSCKIFPDFNPTDTKDILDIHKYLMKKTWYNAIFGLIKKIGLLRSIVNASNHTKCTSLCNQKYMIQPNLINPHPKG